MNNYVHQTTRYGAIVLLILLLPTTVLGELIRLEARGQIDYVEVDPLTGLPHPMGHADIVAGTEFLFAVTYDTEAENESPLRQDLDGAYRFGAANELSKRAEVIVGNHEFLDAKYDSRAVAIGNTTADAFRVGIAVVDPTPPFPDHPFPNLTAGIQLIDSKGTVFSDATIPTQLNLDDFDGATFTLRGSVNVAVGMQQSLDYRVTGRITSLTVQPLNVPEPATNVLLLSSLISVFMLRRPKRP
ncbi:MAG: hypothetical protein R3C28_07540 [Pirellulaceae bacterium]